LGAGGGRRVVQGRDLRCRRRVHQVFCRVEDQERGGQAGGDEAVLFGATLDFGGFAAGLFRGLDAWEAVILSARDTGGPWRTSLAMRCESTFSHVSVFGLGRRAVREVGFLLFGGRGFPTQRSRHADRMDW